MQPLSDDFQTIALFGASGQIGSCILDALFSPSVPDYHPHVRVFYKTSEKEKFRERVKDHERVEKAEVEDYEDVARLKEALKGVDAVVSALNGPGIEAQYALLDAAAEAGVKRFVPSEFGHHHLYRAPGDDGARLHPMWDVKERFNEHLQLHPTMLSGKMSFTIVGCGDFYDQPRETYWCSYAQDPLPGKYRLPCIGDKDAKADFTKITDLAQYIAALLARPSTSHNAHLSFVSDTLSQSEMASLLQSTSGRAVDVDYISEADAHRYIADPESAPEQCKGSAFPVDFWMIQAHAGQEPTGLGTFRRHPAQVHNDLFPEVKVTRFSEWLAQTVGQKAMEE
ncbi:hypothetical protein JCM10450v2_000991 [Rhodotorula kratochvilovae]